LTTRQFKGQRRSCTSILTPKTPWQHWWDWWCLLCCSLCNICLCSMDYYKFSMEAPTKSRTTLYTFTL